MLNIKVKRFKLTMKAKSKEYALDHITVNFFSLKARFSKLNKPSNLRNYRWAMLIYILVNVVTPLDISMHIYLERKIAITM